MEPKRRGTLAIWLVMGLIGVACHRPVVDTNKSRSSPSTHEAPISPVLLPSPTKDDGGVRGGDGPDGGDAPKIDAAFSNIALVLESRPGEPPGIAPALRRRFPALSEDGRRLAVLDERESDSGASLHLVVLDARSDTPHVFTVWTASRGEDRSRLSKAQSTLDSTRWQSLVPGDSGPSDRRPDVVPFADADFLVVEGLHTETVKLIRRTRLGESPVQLRSHGLPGRMGQAAVKTNDVGAGCGAWDYLDEAWVSQDGRTYLFRLGGTIGGRCGTSPVPLEYHAWRMP